MKLKDLADSLGLSQTTVSRALNGYPEVSETTRRRVLEAAERSHYRPNPSARRLATGRAGAVGTVLPTNRNLLVDPHFVEFLAGIGERLVEHEMDIVLCPTREGDESGTYRRIVAGNRVDALILSGPLVEDERVPLLTELGHPFVMHGRTISPTPYAWLDIDNEDAFHRAASHLIDLGHRRIALINGSTRFTFAAHREKGFRRALAEHGLAPDPRLIGEGAMTDEVGFRLAERFLAVEPRPTAFIVSSMMLAFGCLRVIRAAGLALGTDVSLIAHDDVFPFLNADRMVPPLTTLRSPIRAAGTRVAEMLIALLAGRAPETIHELWPVELVIRASTGPAPT
jgi:LacI family transcriptional regulator